MTARRARPYLSDGSTARPATETRRVDLDNGVVPSRAREMLFQLPSFLRARSSPSTASVRYFVSCQCTGVSLCSGRVPFSFHTAFNRPRGPFPWASFFLPIPISIFANCAIPVVCFRLSFPLLFISAILSLRAGPRQLAFSSERFDIYLLRQQTHGS